MTLRYFSAGLVLLATVCAVGCSCGKCFNRSSSCCPTPTAVTAAPCCPDSVPAPVPAAGVPAPAPVPGVSVQPQY